MTLTCSIKQDSDLQQNSCITIITFQFLSPVWPLTSSSLSVKRSWTRSLLLCTLIGSIIIRKGFSAAFRNCPSWIMTIIYDTGPFPETSYSTFACFKKMNEMTEETMFSITSELIANNWWPWELVPSKDGGGPHCKPCFNIQASLGLSLLRIEKWNT